MEHSKHTVLILSVLLGLAIAAVITVTVILFVERSKRTTKSKHASTHASTLKASPVPNGSFKMSIEGAGSSTVTCTALSTFPYFKVYEVPSGAKQIGAMTIAMPSGNAFLGPSASGPSASPVVVYVAHNSKTGDYYLYFRGAGWLNNSSGSSDAYTTNTAADAAKVTFASA